MGDDGARIDAVARKAIKHALAEIIVADATNESGRAPESRDAVDIDACVAAWKRSNEGTGAVHGLVEPGAHDFNKHGADADNIWADGHGSFLAGW